MDSLRDRHHNCAARNRDVSICFFVVCVLFALSLIRNISQPEAAAQEALAQDWITTLGMAGATIYLAYLAIFVVCCLRERLVFGVLAASISTGLLSRLGYGDLLPGWVTYAELALWIIAAAASLSLVVSAMRVPDLDDPTELQGGRWLKWFFLISFVCGVFLCLVFSAALIFAIANNRSWWNILPLVGFFGYAAWTMFKSFREEMHRPK